MLLNVSLYKLYQSFSFLSYRIIKNNSARQTYRTLFIVVLFLFEIKIKITSRLILLRGQDFSTRLTLMLLMLLAKNFFSLFFILHIT